MEYLDEKSEVELISKMAVLSLKLKKQFGAMVIILGQLNDKIEQPERVKVPQLQYPTKTDIHGGKSIYAISDTVIIVNRPELLHMDTYGPRHYPTKDLVAWHFLKSRLNGTEGIIRMKQDFAHGTLIQWEDLSPNESLKKGLF